MNVLFLALGASRRRATVEESAHVVAAGGRAVVLVEQTKAWRRDAFAPGVEVIAINDLEQRQGVRRLERLFLYKGPRFVLFRVVGRRRLRPWARRASAAYERRVANRVHRKLFQPAYDRFSGQAEARLRLIHRYLVAPADLDLVVVTDPMSMPTAEALFGAGSETGPRLTFSVDHVSV